MKPVALSISPFAVLLLPFDIKIIFLSKDPLQCHSPCDTLFGQNVTLSHLPFVKYRYIRRKCIENV